MLMINMKKFLIIFITYVSLVSTENICGNWESFKDEKCIKIINETNLLIYEEAVKLCSQSENGSTLITIHSKEEQEFVEKYVFETQKIEQSIWLGLKNSNNKFEWIDKTSVEFTNWANGSPGNNSDKKCVEMSSDFNPIGQWVDIPCTRKLIVVCERLPTETNNNLSKMLLETKELLKQTRNELIETRKQLTTNEKNFNETTSKMKAYFTLLSNHFYSFIDSDAKQRGFIFPVNENKDAVTFDEANNICNKYNATLVEINSSDKQYIFESFLKQFDLTHYTYFWLNAHKDSSGKWKWLRSGKDFAFNNWLSGYPRSDSGWDYIAVDARPANLGKSFNTMKTYTNYIICELEFNFQI